MDTESHAHATVEASYGPSRRQALVRLDRQSLERRQLRRLNTLLDEILPANQLYARKLADCRIPLPNLYDLLQFPFTTKQELSGTGSNGRYAANLTYPLNHYTRFHRTSGTRGRPIIVVDTPHDWSWWIDCWQYLLDAAKITSTDRVVMAFRYGPQIGFWSAHDALLERGAMVLPAGGLKSRARLDLIAGGGATALFCTPTYALHLAAVAEERGINPAALNIRCVVVAGEPGGSLPATRARIEAAWGATVIDHAGATEVGPWGYGEADGRGLRVIETEFIAEFLSIDTDKPAASGELAQLVVTSLGRAGAPVIRYRTGDLVRPRWATDGSNQFVLLEGGLLGRTDDMMIVRGVNIFPSAVEQILHGFPEVVEYRLIARRVGTKDQLQIEVEDRMQRPQRIADELRLRLGLKVNVRTVPLGSLPRGEDLAKRFVDERN
jgi:phenylacetate-CoA ligase